MKIEQIAHYANVTPSTITKFCQKMNFDGFNELKQSINNLQKQTSFLYEIKNNVTKESYFQTFLDYDYNLNKKIINNLLENKIVKELVFKIENTKEISIISPDYCSSSTLVFYGLMNSYGISCFKVSRKSEESIILNVIQDSNIILLLCSTGDWVKDNRNLIHKINMSSKEIFLIGSSKLEELEDKDKYKIISLGEEKDILKSHYISIKHYDLFFITLCLLVNK